jgi:vacuolar-type H+-ATPase subunit H
MSTPEFFLGGIGILVAIVGVGLALYCYKLTELSIKNTRESTKLNIDDARESTEKLIKFISTELGSEFKQLDDGLTRLVGAQENFLKTQENFLKTQDNIIKAIKEDGEGTRQSIVEMHRSIKEELPRKK